MNIQVDSGLKKKIQIENRKNRRGIYYLWLFEKISFALVIAYAILFPIYCIVTGNLVSTNMRTGKLSYFLVASETSIYTSMGLAAVLFIYVLRIRLEHTFIGGRIDEMIEIVDDKYRLLSSSSSMDRYKIEPFAIRSFWKDKEYIMEDMSLNDDYSNLSELLNPSSLYNTGVKDNVKRLLKRRDIYFK